ncbi:hypothetical protein ABKN59_003549 [Abortiporus biennis]
MCGHGEALCRRTRYVDFEGNDDKEINFNDQAVDKVEVKPSIFWRDWSDYELDTYTNEQIRRNMNRSGHKLERWTRSTSFFEYIHERIGIL